jgi:hypothetical protein
MFDINPLDVLNKRKLSFVPRHFVQTEIKAYERHDEIDSWIKNNLKGRYAYTKIPKISKEGPLKTSTIVAFEDQKEITYFMLACPYLRRM